MGATKKFSIVLSALVMSFLLVLGPASAIQIQLTQPNDAFAGSVVHFTARVDIERDDSNVPIEYSDVVFTGPNNFSETCRVYNDGSYDNCDLNLSVFININDNSYGYGYGYGYFNGYGYDFGYGYGYNPVSGSIDDLDYEFFGEITYNIVWHTPLTIPGGEYKVRVITHAGDKEFESGQKTFDITGVITDVCYEVFELFREEAATGIYDERIDLDEDGDVDTVDLALFTHHMEDSEWCSNVLESGEEENLYQCSEGMIYIDTFSSTENSTLYNVNLATGVSTLKQVIQGDYKHNLAIDKDGNVYGINRNNLGYSDELVKFNADGSVNVIGSIIANEKIGASGFGTDDKLYAVGSENNALYSIDKTTGATTTVKNLVLDVEAGDLVVNENNQVVYLRNNGNVYTIDLNNNSETLHGDIGASGVVFTGLAYVDGVYYATTRTGKLYEFNLSSMTENLIGPNTTQAESGDAASCAVEASESGEESKKVTICHVPNGNKNNAHTLEISENAVQAHLKHGDYLGECSSNKGRNSAPFYREEENNGNNEKELTDQELIDNIEQNPSEPNAVQDNGVVPNLFTGAAVVNGLQGNPVFGIILLAFLLVALLLFINRKR